MTKCFSGTRWSTSKSLLLLSAELSFMKLNLVLFSFLSPTIFFFQSDTFQSWLKDIFSVSPTKCSYSFFSRSWQWHLYLAWCFVLDSLSWLKNCCYMQTPCHQLHRVFVNKQVGRGASVVLASPARSFCPCPPVFHLETALTLAGNTELVLIHHHFCAGTVINMPQNMELAHMFGLQENMSSLPPKKDMKAVKQASKD